MHVCNSQKHVCNLLACSGLWLSPVVHELLESILEPHWSSSPPPGWGVPFHQHQRLGRWSSWGGVALEAAVCLGDHSTVQRQSGVGWGIETGPELDEAPYSNILAWRIVWTEERGGLHSIGSQRVVHDWRKAMTNLKSILKSRDIALLTKFCLVKAMVFQVVLCGYESCTVKKADHWRIDALNCGVGEDSWESLGLQGDPTSQS